MATGERYNGWENYETWAVNLWLNNEYGAYTYWTEMANECLAKYGADKGGHELKRLLEEEYTENMPEVTGLYLDLLTTALQSVFWYEIAVGFMEVAEENAEEEANDDD